MTYYKEFHWYIHTVQNVQCTAAFVAILLVAVWRINNTEHISNVTLWLMTIFSRQTTLCVMNQSDQLNLLSSVRFQMSTGQSAVMICLGVDTGTADSIVDGTWGWQVQLCDPLSTHTMSEGLNMNSLSTHTHTTTHTHTHTLMAFFPGQPG